MPGKGWKMTQAHGLLPSTWETRLKFLASCCNLAQPWPFWSFRDWTIWMEAISLCVPFCHLVFQISKINTWNSRKTNISFWIILGYSSFLSFAQHCMAYSSSKKVKQNHGSWLLPGLQVTGDPLSVETQSLPFGLPPSPCDHCFLRTLLSTVSSSS